MAVVATFVVVASRQVFSLEEVGTRRIVDATLGCALLACFHAAVAFAVGALGASRGLAVGASVLVLVSGYVASFLLPLSDALAGARVVSPWHWAIGQQPVTEGADAGGRLALVLAIAVLLWVGTAAVERRDIRPA